MISFCKIEQQASEIPQMNQQAYLLSLLFHWQL